MDNDFILPENWYIEITNDNREIVNNWRIQKTFNKSLLNNLNYKYVNCNGQCAPWAVGLFGWPAEGSWILITTEQFIEHVLHQLISKSESKKENLDYLIPIFKELNVK